jgi:eukaryotic-like serine/threonine-protein kinase
MASPLEHPNSNLPTSVGPFRIVAALGGGGMGEVYLGERVELFSQRVAIKVLHPARSVDNESVSAMREAAILVSLDHSNIVRLLDRGVSDGGLLYIVMEYVEGAAIDAFCDERRLSVRDRILLLMQVMDAMSYAHRHLVVHSDLKPANILVTSAGEVKLLDFGVATLLKNAKERPAEGVASASFTPLFASPEQRDGGRITVASDVYSLGVVAHLLLTGLSPVQVQHSSLQVRRSASQLVRELDSGTLRKAASGRFTTPNAFVAELTGDLEAVLMKAIQPEPEDRYPSVDAFRADLKCYLDGRLVAARAENRADRMNKWVRRHRLAAAMSLLFLCAVVLSSVGVVWQTAKAARQRRIAQIRLHDLVRLTGTLEGELYDSVNPLSNSEDAKSYLLQGATETLDTLAADDSKDAVLSLELAQQYGKVARLQVAQRGPSRSNHAMQTQALTDVAKGVALLKKIPAGDPAYVTAQRQLAELKALQQTISAT